MNKQSRTRLYDALGPGEVPERVSRVRLVTLLVRLGADIFPVPGGV